MNEKQSTIQKAVSISGPGLHTGKHVTLTFLPQEANFGIKFKRTDLENQPIIPADVDLVTDVSRGTTIELNGAKVQTVEHLLAALSGLQIDNILIELDGPEIPIMDGSSMPFVEVLLSAELVLQDAEREYFEIKEDIRFYDQEKDVEMIAISSDTYRITAMIDYKSPVLGSQHAMLNNIDHFKNEIAQSRTFCFLHEIKELHAKNLIKGGDLNNASVVVDKIVNDEELVELAAIFQKPIIKVTQQGILNNVELRYQNEPARHKLLDIVGDLNLVGVPIKGHIMASKPGHKTNVEFAKLLKAQYKKQKSKIKTYNPASPTLFDINKIFETLPHRYPFVLVDKIIEMSDTHVIGVKNVTINEPYFLGHFPGNPVMPGVLQIEALAQAGGILCLHAMEGMPSDYWTYFVKIDNAKFKDKVVPGDTLILKMELMQPIRRGICLMKGQVIVGDKVVTEAELMAQLVKK